MFRSETTFPIISSSANHSIITTLKLTKNSKAVKLLREKFENRGISDKEDPKIVWESEETFKKHKLNNFRTFYYNMRKEYAVLEGSLPRQCCIYIGITILCFRETVETEEDNDCHSLKRRCTEEDVYSTGRKRLSGNNSHLNDGDCDDMDSGAGMEVVTGEKCFKSLHNISSWIELRTTTQMVTVAIVLPSGIGSGDFSVRVADGGEDMELAVTWPQPLIHVALLHKKWLSSNSTGFQLYHPKCLGFEASLKELRERSSDLIESVARIPVPFPVQHRIYEKYNLGWRESDVKMVYVDLQGFVDKYALVSDKDMFEVV